MKLSSNPKPMFWRAVFWVGLCVFWLVFSVDSYDRAIARHQAATFRLVGIWFWVLILLFWIYTAVKSWKVLRVVKSESERS